jgi:hypothetical protein
MWEERPNLTIWTPIVQREHNSKSERIMRVRNILFVFLPGHFSKISLTKYCHVIKICLYRIYSIFIKFLRLNGQVI